MISWFAKNDVAANLLLMFIVATGIYSAKFLLPIEIFPTIERDQVRISIAQRGTSPADIESGITSRVEEAIADYPEIDEITSTSSENNASVTATLNKGADKQEALNDIKARIDALSTLPTSAEKPIITIPQRNISVIDVMVSGELDEKELSQISQQVETDLLRLPEISQTSVDGVRAFEISINVSEERLREYGLNISDISRAINQQSIDLSAGEVRSKSGDILLATKSQAYNYDEFANITIKNFSDGTRLKLSDIATVEDGFEENQIITRLNGNRAALIKASRTGDESALEIAAAVKQYVKDSAGKFPESVTLTVWDDDSLRLKDRLATLSSSAWQGALLVFILLALFMRNTVAIWVVVGIPVCFAGALGLMPIMGGSINIMSLFGFIVVLGVVVDDAIVTGENIFTHFTRHGDGLRAAIEGTEEVAKPVVFGILTTIVAFVPLTLLTSGHGPIAAAMAQVVIACLIFSLIESKLILPAHLKHLKNKEQRTNGNAFIAWFRNTQDGIAKGMINFANNVYQPFLVHVIKHRYVTLLLFVCMTVLTVMSFSTGVSSFRPFPRMADERATATLTMAQGTPFEVTSEALAKINEAATIASKKYVNEETGESSIIGVTSTLGSRGGNNVARVQAVMNIEGDAPVPINGFQFINEWRSHVGTIMGVESLQYSAERGRVASPVDIQIIGNDVASINSLVASIEERLASYAGVFDIQNNLSNGKRELEITLNPEGELLNLSLQDVAQQVRSAFFGSEAQRIQREKDDIRVMIKYPLSERSDLSALDDLLIKTGTNSEARFSDIATVKWSRSASTIRRIDQLRSVNVVADIDKESVDQPALNKDIREFMTTEIAKYPNLSFSMKGEQEEAEEVFNELMFGLIFVVFAIYALLAIPFKSYTQPFIVMLVIPFSLVGAVAGHWITGQTMSILSIFGMLALLGILVNDSLVMVDWINRRVGNGMDKMDAVFTAGAARFRPIILTSITTFAGIFPILLDKSSQAAFLKPMATSLGFGVLFATFITLLMVPCNYVIFDDIRKLKERIMGSPTDPDSELLPQP